MGTAADPTAYRPIPGPVDRVTFFEAQRRHRRASRRFSLVAAGAVLLTGLPLSIVITPFVYALALIVGYAVNTISPLPPDTWRLMRMIPLLIPTAVGALTSAQGTTVHLPPQQQALFALALVAPGAIFLLLIWIGLRTVFRHAGVGGVLLTLGARQPNPNDLEERQLTNVVEEMAIAAGVPLPQVMLIDAAAAGGAANAAAVGWSIQDATIVVTRPLLDGLRRDETQAIVGRLIGGVGNGDLKIALIIVSLFQTIGLVTLGLNTFFGFRSWRVLWRLLRLSLTPRRARSHDALQASVMAALASGADFSETDDYSVYIKKHSDPKGCAAVLQLPLLLCVGFPIFVTRFIVSLSMSVVTGPLLGAMWKQRELLADATAVQLTRNPDGLAAALERLSTLGTAVPRAESVSHLFAVWGRRTSPPFTPAQAQAYRELLQGNMSPAERIKALAAARDAVLAARAATTTESSAGGGGTESEADSSGAAATISRYMHASIEKRLKQLTALGAHPDPQTRPDFTPANALKHRPHKAPWLLFAIVAPIALLLTTLMAIAFGLIMMLDLVFMTIMLAVVWFASYFAFVKAPILWHAYRSGTSAPHPGSPVSPPPPPHSPQLRHAPHPTPRAG